MSKLIRRRVLLAKVESIYNTDPTPTGASNAIMVEDLNWGTEALRMVDRVPITSSLAPKQQVYGGSLLGCTFATEIKGSGAAGTAPEISPLLLGCGLAETLVASTSATYAPASASQSSITLYLYEDGTLTILTGCRGNMEIVADAGGRMMAAWTFQGHFSGPTDVALATPTYDSTVPPIMIGGSFVIGAYGAIIQSLAVSLGNTLEASENFNAADGYGEVQITARDVQGSFNPEQTLVATKNFMANFKAGTLEAINTGVLGSTAGNRIQLQLPKTYYRDISPSERTGILAYDLPFGAAENSGDDELSLAFT